MLEILLEIHAELVKGAGSWGGLRPVKSKKMCKAIARVRLFTLAFSDGAFPVLPDVKGNVSAHRLLILLAGVHKGGWIPAEYLPDESEIEKEMRALAPEFARDLAAAHGRLCRFLESGQ